MQFQTSKIYYWIIFISYLQQFCSFAWLVEQEFDWVVKDVHAVSSRHLFDLEANGNFPENENDKNGELFELILYVQIFFK